LEAFRNDRKALELYTNLKQTNILVFEVVDVINLWGGSVAKAEHCGGKHSNVTRCSLPAAPASAIPKMQACTFMGDY